MTMPVTRARSVNRGCIATRTWKQPLHDGRAGFSLSAQLPVFVIIISTVSLGVLVVLGAKRTAASKSSWKVYTLANPIPAGTQIYSSSRAHDSSSGPLWEIPIPAHAKSLPLQHCWGNTSRCTRGDAMAKYMATANNQCNPAAPANNTSGCGLLLLQRAQLSSDTGPAIWYSDPAKDPYYSIGSACNYNSPGLRATFQCPSNATFGGSTTDQNIVCYDQSQQLIWAGYAFNKGKGFSLGKCSGTKTHPCPIPGISACSIARAGLDASYNANQTYVVTTPDSYTLGRGGDAGGAPLATVIRIQEIVSGNINHAVGVVVPCTSNSNKPFPGNGQTDLLCSKPNSGLPVSPDDPVYSGLYFLDYTPEQIDAMRLPAWQTAVLKSMSTYGFYPLATGASGMSFEGFNFLNFVESQTAYAVTGVANSPVNSLCSQRGWAVCITGSPAQAVAEGDVLNGSIPLVVSARSASTDSSGRACGSGGGCDWTGHVHLLDPCVAKTMAGQSGGC